MGEAKPMKSILNDIDPATWAKQVVDNDYSRESLLKRVENTIAELKVITEERLEARRCRNCRYAEKGGLKDEELHCELMESPGEPLHPESLAIGCDAEEYSAWVVVKPDFGCVQFAPRPPEQVPIGLQTSA
jgi:hypothetical protein